MNTIHTNLSDLNKKQAKFIQFCKPGLDSGNYTINLTQTTAGQNTDPLYNNPDYNVRDTFTLTKHFLVKGQRFALDPSKVYSTFPINNQQGDFSNCLPHIVFTDTTLPWQRDAGDAAKTPWLALIVFYPEDISHINIAQVTLDSFKTASLPSGTTTSQILFYNYDSLDPDESPASTCTAIDIPIRLFNQIAPCIEDIPYLCHVREIDVTNKSVTPLSVPSNLNDASSIPTSIQYSVVAANRLPPTEGKITTHLISLENMGQYLPDAAGVQSTQIPNGIEYIRLVSLQSWTFEVTEPKGHLSDIFSRLNTAPITLRIPDLVNDEGPSINLAFEQGYTPTNHNMRAGENTVSWYRGPFVPYQVADIISWPNSCADALLKYDPSIAMFDISYAAAWQLGRLLALQNKSFAECLYLWKRSNVQSTIEKLYLNELLKLMPLHNSIEATLNKHAISKMAMNNIIIPALSNYLNNIKA